MALEGEESPESQQAEKETDLEPQIPPEQRTGLPLNQAPIWQRMIVMSAGAVMNFVLGFVVLAVLIAAQNEPITSRVVYEIEPGALCGQTGLAPRDEILEVNGRRCFVANDILYELVRTESNQADFTVRRDGELVELPGVQFDTWQDEQGQTHMDIGFTVYGIERTPLQCPERGRAQCIVLWPCDIYLSYRPAAGTGEHQRPVRSGGHRVCLWSGSPLWMAGPAGAGGADHDQPGYLHLLPFPALDGGKVVFLLIEAVIGRPVPEKIQGALTIAAFALLFGLMLFATYNDIIRLLSGAL